MRGYTEARRGWVSSFLRPSFKGSSGPAEGLGERVDSHVELIILNQNRRQEPDDGPSGRKDENTVLLHRLDHRGDWLLELDGLHQAPAADLADLGKSQPTNAFLETLARPGGAGMQRLVRQHPQRDGSGDANQRIAGEGAAMAPLGNALTDRLGRDGHADR